MKKYDIAIIGAGASGLMTAIKAKKENKSVIILENNSKIAKKLLATGNGRCNIVNKNITPMHFHGDVDQIKYILNKYTPDILLEEFEKIGIFTFSDSEGRYYPKSLQASQVAKALYDNLCELNVDFKLNFNVCKIEKSGKLFHLKSNSGECITANTLVLACGGAASPKHSGMSNGYSLLKQLGHTSTNLSPALTKFDCSDKFIKPLSGVKAKCKASLIVSGKTIYSECGEMIFSDKTLSGICLFNLSIYANPCFLKNEKVFIKFDFLEDLTENELFKNIKKLIFSRPKMKSEDILNAFLNIKLANAIVKKSGIDANLPAEKLTDNQIISIISTIKKTKLQVSQHKNWDNAQVTDGGIPLKEIDVKTMQSKICPNLYLAGEILNIHGDCGGYNLYWAWTTGLIAGENIK